MTREVQLYLAADVGIAAIVGARIYLQRAPQSVTAAYIRLTTISAVPELLHSGDLGATEDYTRVQIDFFSADDTQIAALYPLLRARVLQFGHVVNSRFAEPFDHETQRWRGSMDIQFYPVDVPAP